MGYEITGGKIKAAKRIVIYGPEGIGKSTFAAQFPDPVFIDTEGSTKEMDVRRFPAPTSWTMLLEEVQEVIKDPSLCRTLVIDTADWAEQLEITELCERKGWTGIEDPGYGKGYSYSAEEFGKLLNLLTTVSDKGVNVVLTAHAQLRKIELPEEMGAYDHWEMKTSKKVAPMIREWATAVFFANYKTMVVEVDKKKKAQGGRRVMYTNHTPFWDAKNRYGLPDELPFDFKSIAQIFADVPASAAKASAETPRKSKPATAQQKQQPETTPATIPVETTPATVPVKAEHHSNDRDEMPAKSSEEPAKEETRKGPAAPPGMTEQSEYREPDPAIDPALRDLMIANKVDEWDIQNVVTAKGYMPALMPVRDYPQDFVKGWCIPWFDKIKEMALEYKESMKIPFN